MPITKELSNIKKLEAVGFPHEQAEALTDIIEQSHVDSQQGIKEFVGNKIDTYSKEIRSEITSLELRLKASQTEMGLRLKTAQTDLLLKFSGIVAAFISAALAIAKLLW